jgi:hypothetical protein
MVFFVLQTFLRLPPGKIALVSIQTKINQLQQTGNAYAEVAAGAVFE